MVVISDITCVWQVFDTLQGISAAAEHTNNGAYVKLKEIRLDQDCPVLRVKFDFRKEYINYSYYVHARIYLNGSPIGTERAKNNQTYTTYSEDFTAGYSDGDLIQLYVKDDGAYDYAQVRNFGIYASKNITDLDVYELVTPLQTTDVLANTVIS
jgi:hypothetical protein